MITIALIQQAISLPSFDITTAHQAMLPLGRPISRPKQLSGNPRIGSVMLLFYCYKNTLHLVLTKRRDELKAHGGQISFPGGRQDAGESLEETAVRETSEEIGVEAGDIEIIGTLNQVYIPPSDFQVYPFVSWVSSGKKPTFIPSEDEVSEIIEVSIDYLLNPAIRKTERRKFRGELYDVPYFDVYGHQVWGATAVILNELIERLKTVQPTKYS